MAIQLNDRDQLIFTLIDEHRVLLEKHISWFISGDDKPVLIRDRLRKLFYLDYLLCHRHGTKLPWWTTPTKPLVYMLSPMSRSLTGSPEEKVDLFDANIQRHYLEVANLRMLGLMDQKEGHLKNFEWSTMKPETSDNKLLDAKISFENNGKQFKIGIINHPESKDDLIASIDNAINSGLGLVLIVSRDDAHQQELKKLLAQSDSINARRCLFATHHELYREGLMKTSWVNCEDKTVDVFQVAAQAHWTSMPVAPVTV